MPSQRQPRFAVLTDAAIELLAEAGMRGLTHRAVDVRAGLPQGSTSVCFRTRKALIEAVVRRLAELEQAEVDRGGSDRDAAAPRGSNQLDQLAEQLAGVVDRLLSVGRSRTLARYACLLEATHHPELRDILAHRVRFRDQAGDLLARAGGPNAQRRGPLLVAFVNGLVFDRLLGAGALTAPTAGTPQSRRDLQATIAIALHGLFHAPE